MNSLRKNLRAMIEKKETIVAPGAFDALTAKVVERLGFKAAYMGGWITGAHLGVTEPLMTLTEQVGNAFWATRILKIPLIVDADAGFGDAVHTYRAVQEFERAGVAAIHIEDQVFPKRAHYHKGIEHVAPLEEFIAKLKSALAARTDKDFIIMARTDARDAVGGSLEEAIRRGRACADAGVDVVLPHLRGSEEMKIFRQEVPNIPLVAGHAVSRILSVKEIEQLGYQFIFYPLDSILAAIEGVIRIYTGLKETGRISMAESRQKELMSTIQEMIGLPDYYRIEEVTTEKSG
jgi:2-methylisocitrate lyase-like PEP mutase family enzyme